MSVNVFINSQWVSSFHCMEPLFLHIKVVLFIYLFIHFLINQVHESSNMFSIHLPAAGWATPVMMENVSLNIYLTKLGEWCNTGFWLHTVSHVSNNQESWI